MKKFTLYLLKKKTRMVREKDGKSTLTFIQTSTSQWSMTSRQRPS